MVPFRIFARPAFTIVGQKTWIGGQDNSLFGRFWDVCQAEGVLARLAQINAQQPGAQTGGDILGVSRVEQDPAKREFYYMIAVETPQGVLPEDMEAYEVPACTWAAFDAHGKMPEALVRAEMFAFMEWLPGSGYVHAAAPEMEVYLPRGNRDETRCEFWLPLAQPK